MNGSFVRIESIFQEHATVVASSSSLCPEIHRAAEAMVACLTAGGKILACGNGGSAADAQHFVCELVGRFLQESAPYAAVALTTDPSTVSAIGNDYGFECVFERQVQAHGKPRDVLLAISTSGSSANVVRAAKEAKSLEMIVIAMTGQSGGALRDLADVCLMVPSTTTPRIQEVHELIVHALCQVIEEELA